MKPPLDARLVQFIAAIKDAREDLQAIAAESVPVLETRMRMAAGVLTDAMDRVQAIRGVARSLEAAERTKP